MKFLQLFYYLQYATLRKNKGKKGKSNIIYTTFKYIYIYFIGEIPVQLFMINFSQIIFTQPFYLLTNLP